MYKVGCFSTLIVFEIFKERTVKKYDNGVGNGNATSTSCPSEYDSQFIILSNRLLGFSLGILIISIMKQPKHKAPVVKYSFSVLCGIVGSWCQYESLKFLHFIIQVVGKSCKLVCVMIVGKIMNKKSFHLYEYFSAFVMTVGKLKYLQMC